MNLLAQSVEATADTALMSVAGILTATWLIVAFAKYLLPDVVKGRVTLLTALGVSIGLTLYATYGLGSINGGLASTLLAVLTGVAGAAGINASGKGVFGKAPLVPLAAALLLLGGCAATVPADLVERHLDAMQPDHESYYHADPTRSAAEIQALDAGYQSMRDVLDAARGGTGSASPPPDGE